MNPVKSILILFAVCACKEVQFSVSLSELPAIYPDYKEVTIPSNIVPMNFSWLGDNGGEDFSNTRCRLRAGVSQPFRDGCWGLSGARCRLNVRCDAGEWQVRGSKGLFSFSRKMWKKMVSADEIEFTVLAFRDGEWVSFKPFSIYVAPESIDSRLSYRLIPTLYGAWFNGYLGIYQRNLESYREEPVLENRQTGGNCINCHSYCNRNPETMLLHSREVNSGTLVIHGNDIEKLNTKTDSTTAPFAYPYWHPSGKYAAFAIIETFQNWFNKIEDGRMEYYDISSDVVVCDIDSHKAFWSPLTKSEKWFETWPAFSPDGKWLYFCRAEAVDNLPENYQKVKYALVRIAFNPEDGSFGDRLEMVFDAPAMDRSVSLPRISPDGRWLAFTLQKFGNSSTWHRDADIWMLDLERLGASCEGDWNGAGEGGRYENEASAVRNGVGGGSRYENGASVRNGCSEPVGTRKGPFSYETAVRGRLVRAKGDFRTASSTDGEDYGCTKESSDCCAAWPATELNSDESESYHCWSSNGRWLVFSSRRDDGLFTRPYIAYIDTNGIARKPFMLPQRNPKEYYEDLMYSYNIPELMTGPVTVPARTMAKVLRESPGTDVGL